MVVVAVVLVSVVVVVLVEVVVVMGIFRVSRFCLSVFRLFVRVFNIRNLDFNLNYGHALNLLSESNN